MSENQPREYDVVLGGDSQTPVDGVVLGGIEGVKRRLKNPDLKAQVAGLYQALNYGEAGLELIIQAWQNELGNIKHIAHSLLREREEATVKQALEEYNPWLKMDCIHTLQDVSLCFAINSNRKVFFKSVNSINILDIDTGEIEVTSMNHVNLRNIIISPNGKKMITRGGESHFNSGIAIWDLHTQERLFFFNEASGRHDPSSLAISPDGSKLFCAVYYANTGINIWDLNTGENISNFPSKSYEQVKKLAISKDGKIIISSGNDYYIKVRNVETKELIYAFKHKEAENSIESLAISPNGKIVVSASQCGRIRIWNLETKKLQFTLEEHKAWVYCVAISPDGSTIVSCSRDKKIKIWDLYTGECIRILKGHTHWVYNVAISPDGKTLASSSSDGTVKIWGLK